MHKIERSRRFKQRFGAEERRVQDRFSAPLTDQPPGIEALVVSDPETWSMPLSTVIKYLGLRQSFLSGEGEELLADLLQYDTPNVNARVVVDANIDGLLIVALCAYDKRASLVTWLTIGSTPVV